jgi:cold shock CspA family protein
MIGRLTYWNNTKGFGFIQTADGSAKYFFHYSNFQGTPVLGAIVVFNLGDPIALGKKIQAVGVRFATQTEIEQANYIRSFDVGMDALKAGV